MINLKRNFLFLIFSIVSAILIVTFIVSYKTEIKDFNSTFNSNVYSIENALSKTADFLEINGMFANRTFNSPYLEENFKNYKYSNLLDYIKYDKQRDIFHLDDVSTIEIESNHFNNIVGRGNLDFLKDENNIKTKELYFSILLNNNFSILNKKLPNSYRISYISLNALMAIHTPDEFLTTDTLSQASGILHKPFIQMGSKENLKNRNTVFWTNPYVDPEENGLLVTASYPVDYKDEYIGLISTDFTTKSISKLFDNSYFITIALTQDGTIISENTGTTNFSEEITSFDSLPVALKYEDVKELTPNKLSTIKGSKVISHNIKNTPYTLYQIYSFKNLALNIFITLLPLLIFIALFIIVNVNYYKMREAKKVQAELLYAANFDALTNVYNRRGFNKEVESLNTDELKNSSSILLLDIDHFKNVNDTYGHDVGDEVLSELCNVINRCTVKDEVISRFGGEEFVVLLKQQPLEKAIELAEKIRSEVESNTFKTVKHLTVSIGVSSLNSYETVDESLKNADNALYKAKETSRNVVYYYVNDTIKPYKHYFENKEV